MWQKVIKLQLKGKKTKLYNCNLVHQFKISGLPLIELALVGLLTVGVFVVELAEVVLVVITVVVKIQKLQKAKGGAPWVKQIPKMYKTPKK